MNTTPHKKLVSILVPCYNEEASLPHLWAELQKIMTDDYDWEVLFVNDGSKDRTLQILNELYHTDERVSVVDLSRNYGKEKAMLAGFDHVAGDCMVIIDADLQDPPRLIAEMLQKWEEGYDDVYAHRISRGKESWLKRKFSLLFYRILQKGSSLDIPENVGDFRLLDRKCIEALKELRESERYTKGLFCQIGFKKIGIDFDRDDRVAGTTKWNFRKLFFLAVDGIVSFSNFPLRISTLLGSIAALVSLILGGFYLIKAAIFGDSVGGFPTLIVVILFLGGVQLLSIGIIGEYVGRIFIESKHRPVYYINSYKSHISTQNNAPRHEIRPGE